MASPRIAVVTGSNKGIGYAVVKGLAKDFDGVIYMTARNPELGEKALAALKAEVGANGSKVRFHQLDIGSDESVNAFKEFIQKEHGGIELLVNNAAIAFKNNATESFAEQAEVTTRTNYFGTKRVSRALIPMMRKDGRVVNVCSRAGLLSNGAGPTLKEKLTNSELSVEQLDAIVEDFVKCAKDGTAKAKDYPTSTYAFSKMAQIALSNIQSRKLATYRGELNIIVNACCPGYVDTDMTSHKGTKTPEDGADTLLYLALLPIGVEGPKGKFVAERKEIDWVNDKLRP